MANVICLLRFWGDVFWGGSLSRCKELGFFVGLFCSFCGTYTACLYQFSVPGLWQGLEEVEGMVGLPLSVSAGEA